MSDMRKKELIEMANGKEELLEEIDAIIHQFALTEKMYARVFCLLNFDSLPRCEQLTFSPADKAWMRNGRTLSDVKLFSILSNVCDVVREYVNYSWESCVFSSWMSNRELQKAEKDMDNMESLVKMKSVIRIAADFMRTDDHSGKVRWDDVEPADEPTEDED